MTPDTFTMHVQSITHPTGGPELRVPAVSYSPPFQAPHEFCDALACFAALVEAPAAVYAHQLCDSEAVVVFHNCRALHGRTVFGGRKLGSMGLRGRR
jgi:hypothetical protein